MSGHAGRAWSRRGDDPVAATRQLKGRARSREHGTNQAGRLRPPPRGPTDSVLLLQRAVGNRRVTELIGPSHGDLQRQVRGPGADTSEVAHSSTMPFPPFGELTTYRQIAAAGRFTTGQIEADLARLAPNGEVGRRARDWMERVRFWLPYLDDRADQLLSPAAAATARHYLDEAVVLRNDIARAGQAVIDGELRRVRAAAVTAAQRTEALRPPLADAMRAAFRAGDTRLLADLLGLIGTVTDLGLGMHSLARETAAAVGRLASVDLVPVGRYVAGLERLNRGLAAINLAMSSTEARAATALEEGLRQVGVAAGAFSSLATLARLPAHMGLYANMYLVPLTRGIVSGLTRVTNALHVENRTWVAIFGRPARFGVEPGGEPMWDFMDAVMAAGTPSDVPAIPEPVQQFLMEHRARFEAGTGDVVPTSGWWPWRSLHSAAARDWVFANRHRLWAMLYGSMAVPSRGR
jgi:hypothetical protein